MTRPILVILPSIAPAGAEIQAMLQIRELARRGVPVRLVVLSRIVDRAVLATSGLATGDTCLLRNRAATLGGAFLRALWRDLPRAAAFAAAHGTHTIIAHLPPAHFFARLLFLALLARRRRVRLVQYHHSPERRLNPHDTSAKRLFHGLDGLLGRITDHTHWHVSTDVRDDVAAGFTRRNAILPNTCDMDSPGDPEAAARLIAPIRAQGDAWIILVPGRLKWMKGHALFLRALARVCRAEGIRPDGLQVLLAGEGDERPRIEVLVAELGLADRVTLAGEIAHAALLTLYPLADLVVIPSLDEGFGIVAIEAISRGALVIASDAGGLGEIVRHGENGFRFPAANEDALAAALTTAWQCRDAPLIDREAARRDCARRFGPEAHVDRLLSFLPE